MRNLRWGALPREAVTSTGSVVLYQGAAGIYGLSLFLASVAFLRKAVGLARVACGALLAGLVLHAVVLVDATRSAGAHPLTTPWTITSGFTFVALLGAYLLTIWYGMRLALSVLFGFPVVVALASLTLDPAFAPFGTRLDGAVVQLHIGALIVAYAAFTLSASLGGMLVVRSRILKAKRQGLLDDVLPPLLVLDRATMLSLHVGFLSLTLAHLLGAGHAWSEGWQSAGKSIKAALAVAVWGCYLVVLVGRIRYTWRGERVGWMALVSAAVAFGAFLAMEYVGTVR